MKQRMLSLLLCCVIFCSAFSGITLTGKAKEIAGGDAGTYEEHKHTEECYQLVTKCLHKDDNQAEDSSEIGEDHVCTEESGCVTRVLICPYGNDGVKEELPGDKGEEKPEEPEEQKPDNTESPDPTEGQEPKEEASMMISSWEWIDEEEVLVWSEEHACWGLGMPGANEENRVTAEILSELLPKSITASLAEGQTETLMLDWDFSVLPEEGAFEGSYELVAGLPEGYVLGDEVLKLCVLLEFGGGETYEVTDKYVGTWEYVPRGGLTIDGKDNQYYSMEYHLYASDLSEEVAIRRLKGVLPEKLLGEGFNTGGQLVAAGLIYAGTEVPTPVGKIQGYVNLKWNVEEVVKNAFSTGKKEELTFYAVPISNDGYRIRVNTNAPDLKDEAGDELDNVEDPSVLNLTVKIILHDLPLEDHIVSGINPPSTTVNLFDYCVDPDRNGADGKDDRLNKSEVHHGASGTSITNVERTGMEDWNKGINKNRLLLFGDGNIHAGFWNKGAGAGSDYGKAWAGMTGIVKPVLDENGYPVIDVESLDKNLDKICNSVDANAYQGISDWQLCGDHKGQPDDKSFDSDSPQNISNKVIANWNKEASLDYLFALESIQSDKRFYQDVKGLFQIDNNGYYYYDMRKNFAEYDKGKNEFILYDAPAVDRTDASYENGGFTGGRSTGNFFPFNTGEQVFDTLDDEGKLASSDAIQSNNLDTTGEYMNHHLGMTVTIDFLQPASGRLNTGTVGNVPMTFQFSGDDDVWIFIDDVLVLDLGGIHSEIYGTIDFSSGNISIGQSWKTNGFPYKNDGTVDMDMLLANAVHSLDTTLKDQFKAAGKEHTTQWSNNTFASNTSHTLKMFYLERGNYDSSLALRFNLQPLLYQQVRKVDQNGSPIEGVKFELRPATSSLTDTGISDKTPGAIQCLYTDATVGGGKEFYVKEQENTDAFIQLVTGLDGTARFLDKEGNYFNFADRGEQYYILKETKTPDGYRSLPTDIVLHYDPSNAMLSVANRWSTGAYACSVVHIVAGGRLSSGSFDPTTQNVVPDKDLLVDPKNQENGVAVAIPMLKKQTDNTWEALYGSNLNGFTAIKLLKADGTEDILRAALKQAEEHVYNNAPNWNLSWDSEGLRLAGSLNDLPGLANRYEMNNNNGDLRMFYALISPEALEKLGIQKNSARERYEALGKYVKAHGVEETLKVIRATNQGFHFLNADQFNRNFRSLIYIPNEQRELWVMKVDQDGKLRNGAKFGLFSDKNCKNLVADGTTATVRGQEGTLIFSPSRDSSPGHATVPWARAGLTHYYLKELSAPEGCMINSTIIPVVVGTYSIYADAGTKEDGVTVMAGVGRLTQTMRQYAMGNDVDITLQDITAIAQQQPSNKTNVLPGEWNDVELKGTKILRSMNLHFGKNAVVDYGLHDEDGGKLFKPFFVTDTGFIRARVKQNYEALVANPPIYGDQIYDANKDDLKDADLTNLFSLLNVVVVTDETNQDTNTGQLVISKMLVGTNLIASDYTKNFRFTIQLTDANGKELPGKYYFYGTDKSGYISSGEEIPLHHDERIVVLGLPAGTHFTVTEAEEQDWHAFPSNGVIHGEIFKEEPFFATFYNRKDEWKENTGFLNIHKTVTGIGDRTKEFTFQVTFTTEDGVELTEGFLYTGDKEGTIFSGQSITLSHEQYISVLELPVGTRYTVLEKEENQDGYKTSYRGEVGVIANGELGTASITNTKGPKLRPIPDPDPTPPTNRNTRTVSNSPSNDNSHSVKSPRTDDAMDKVAPLRGIILAILGILLFSNRKLRKDRGIAEKE